MVGPYYLGIDGGGTGCRARLTASDGRVLGEGAGGPANLTLGLEVAEASIDAAVAAAFVQAGLSPDIGAQTYVGMGLAGANVPELRAGVEALRHPFAGLTVVSDAEIACRGAFRGGDGAILILGTGSQGLACVAGKVTSVGGWGFPLSDDGSGALLGRSALRAAIRSYDGLSPPSPLTAAILDRFDGRASVAAQWAMAARPADYGALAPLVLAHRAGGDSLAIELIDETIAAVSALIERLAALGAGSIALMGGFAGALRPYLPEPVTARLVAPKGDALDGALLMARTLSSARGGRMSLRDALPGERDSTETLVGTSPAVTERTVEIAEQLMPGHDPDHPVRLRKGTETI